APEADIDISSSASRIQVLGCNVSHAATGIMISGHNVLVDGCKAHDNDRMYHNGADCDQDPTTSGEHGGQAFAVNNTTGPVEIRDSQGWNNSAASICYGHDGAFVELYYATNVNMHHNQSRNGVVTMETAGDTSGDRFWGNEV